MTAIERAEALLETAESRCAACTCGAPPPQPCGPHCEYPYPDGRQPVCGNCTARVAVRATVPSKAELLRGYIGAVKALEDMRSVVDESAGVVGWHLNGAVATWGEFEFEAGMEQSIADFERLFPEPASPAPRSNFDIRG